MKEPAQSLQLTTAKPTKASRPWPPLWVFALAVFLGGLGAWLSPFLHVHWNGHHAYVHRHGFLGSHSHPQGPEGPPAPEGSEKDDRGSVALAAAIALEVFVPRAVPASRQNFLVAEGLPRSPAPRLLGKAPWAPRGPPVHPC